MRPQGKILAVDDNPLNLKVLRSLLAEHDLRTAMSGAEALDVASRFRPDLVLLDVMMPGMDGYSTCRHMRAYPALRHTKIIMLSAKSLLKERLAGYEAGADDYIAKPFDGEELLAKVRVYLKLKSVEEVEDIKNRTIEVLQHSNRTPLTNIIFYAELLAADYGLDDEARRQAPQVILRNAHRLQQLLEKGETLASMKSGQYFFAFVECDLGSLMHDALERWQERCATNGIALYCQVPPSFNANLDPSQIRFVIDACIDNAVRYSQPGGAVTVDLARYDDELVVTISDRGLGIPPDLLPRVFEPFGNPDSPLFNQGDGLSLAIAQHIAWAHEGDMQVESEFGHGTTISLHIPVNGPRMRSSQNPAERKVRLDA